MQWINLSFDLYFEEKSEVFVLEEQILSIIVLDPS